MLIDPGITRIDRRGLDLDGWGERSVWGWDSQSRTLFAQLWRDGDDDDDEEDHADDRPDIWISPPAWQATGEAVELARRISEMTQRPVGAVLVAMARSVAGDLRAGLLARAENSARPG